MYYSNVFIHPLNSIRDCLYSLPYGLDCLLSIYTDGSWKVFAKLSLVLVGRETGPTEG